MLHMLWDESLDFVKGTEMRSRIQGVSSCMRSFNFFFGVSLGKLLLRHTDNLSKTLQASSISAAEGQKIADMTVRTLQSIRPDENFYSFGNQPVRRQVCLASVSQHFLDREIGPKGMKMKQAKVMFLRVWKFL